MLMATEQHRLLEHTTIVQPIHARAALEVDKMQLAELLLMASRTLYMLNIS